MPLITPRDTTVAVVGAGGGAPVAVAGHQVTVYDGAAVAGGTMLVGVPAFPAPRRHRDGLPARRAARRHLPLRHAHRTSPLRSCSSVDAAAILRRCRPPCAPLRARQRPGRHPVRRRCAAPTSWRAHRGGSGRGHHRWWLHGHGLLAHTTSLRHGARNVTIAYRRTRSELVVDEEELGETEREGVIMDVPGRDHRALPKAEAASAACVSCATRRTGCHRPARCPSKAPSTPAPAQTVIPARQPGGRQHLPARGRLLRGQPRPDAR